MPAANEYMMEGIVTQCHDDIFLDLLDRVSELRHHDEMGELIFDGGSERSFPETFLPAPRDDAFNGTPHSLLAFLGPLELIWLLFAWQWRHSCRNARL